MNLPLGWWSVLVVSLGLAAWTFLRVRGGMAWLAGAANSATAFCATLILGATLPGLALDLMYAGFALGIASFAWGLVRAPTDPWPARLAAGWSIAVPIGLAAGAMLFR